MHDILLQTNTTRWAYHRSPLQFIFTKSAVRRDPHRNPLKPSPHHWTTILSMALQGKLSWPMGPGGPQHWALSISVPWHSSSQGLPASNSLKQHLVSSVGSVLTSPFADPQESLKASLVLALPGLPLLLSHGCCLLSNSILTLANQIADPP